MSQDTTPLFTRKRIVAAKSETTTGTAEALTGAEGAFIVYCDDNPWEENIDMEQRPKMNSAGQFPAVPATQSVKFTFEAEMIGSSSVPAWASTFLPACNWTLSSRTFTLDPFPASMTTLTISLQEGTRWRKMTGAMGNVVFSGKAGHFCRAKFTFMGCLAADADAAQVSPTFPSGSPPRWAQANGLSLGSFAPLVSTFEVDAGCDVQMRESENASCGYRSAMIADALPKASFDPEASLVATRAVQSLLLASTEEALSIIIGSTSNNIITIASTAAQVVKREGGARNKMLLDALNLQLNAMPTIAFT
jgi:hypothetical protein